MDWLLVPPISKSCCNIAENDNNTSGDFTMLAVQCSTA